MPLRARAAAASVVVLLAALCGCAGHAFSLQEENDSAGVVGPDDRDYTQGLQLAWSLPRDTAADMFEGVLEAMPFTARPDVTGATFFVWHRIYGPDDIARTMLIEDDRPYAGWLDVGLQLHSLQLGDHRRDDAMTTWELSLGVIGPAAHAEDVQEVAHEVTNFNVPLGWHHQLPDEPTVTLKLEQQRRLAHDELDWPLRAQLDFIGIGGFTVGNVHDYLELGLAGRWGGLPRDFARRFPAPSANPEGPAADDRAWPFYLFAEGRVRAVLFDALIEGTAFHDSHGVEARPFVGELTAGAVLPLGSWSLGFSVVVHTPEFEERSRWHHYGSLQVTVRF